MKWVLISAVLLLAGCASSQKVEPFKAGDYDMSCTELSAELAKLNEAQGKVDENKSANGTNVAAAVLWLPGLAYTFHDAGEATKLINERRANLEHYQAMKKCRA